MQITDNLFSTIIRTTGGFSDTFETVQHSPFHCGFHSGSRACILYHIVINDSEMISN